MIDGSEVPEWNLPSGINMPIYLTTCAIVCRSFFVKVSQSKQIIRIVNMILSMVSRKQPRDGKLLSVYSGNSSILLVFT